VLARDARIARLQEQDDPDRDQQKDDKDASPSTDVIISIISS
jgi:hypothetical protein